jgi:excinuclease ABC subunit C
MKEAANAERFEEAALYKRRIDTLYGLSSYKYDPAVFLEQGIDSVFDDELQELKGYLQKAYPELSDLSRIECFDMSQLFGTSPVGSMVVLTEGTPDKREYRKFRIKREGTVSDASMMHEVLERRFRHDDWPTPNFVLIDGGKMQLSIAAEVFAKLHITVPYAGLAKRYEEIIVPTVSGYKTLRLPLSSKALRVLQRVRDEAHRFAITYHRLLRSKKMIS